MADLMSPKMNLPEIKPVKQADPEDPTVLEAGKKKRREEEERLGRASTNLSGAAAGAMPKTYSSTDLGA